MTAPDPQAAMLDAIRGEAEALRGLIREAHEVLGDLRRERRAVEGLLRDFGDRVDAAVKERVEAAVKRDVAALGEATERAMDAAVAKVHREFDRLERIFTGRERPGPDLEELARRYLATPRASGYATRQGRRS